MTPAMWILLAIAVIFAVLAGYEFSTATGIANEDALEYFVGGVICALLAFVSASIALLIYVL